MNNFMKLIVALCITTISVPVVGGYERTENESSVRTQNSVTSCESCTTCPRGRRRGHHSQALHRGHHHHHRTKKRDTSGTRGTSRMTPQLRAQSSGSASSTRAQHETSMSSGARSIQSNDSILGKTTTQNVRSGRKK